MNIRSRLQPLIVLGIFLAAGFHPAAAGVSQAQIFGSGLAICPAPLAELQPKNPTVVTNCTQTGLQAALDGGGWITFDCGPDPVTIPLETQLELSTETDTLIDGGGLVTLDGQDRTRLLFKGWHDPVSVGEITVRLQNIRLMNGRAPGGSNTGDHSGGAINAGHPGTRLHIHNVTFENNHTTEIHIPDNQGGAIFAHNAYETVISASEFRSNTAGNGGAVGAIASGMLIYNSRFIANQALDDWDGDIVRGYGGALHLDGVTNSYNPASHKTVEVCGSEFTGNTAVRGGGALSSVVSDNKGTKLTVDRATFEQNEVFGYPDPANPGEYKFGQGGALYHIEDDHAGASAEDNFEVRATLFHANRARKQGGAAWVYILGFGRVVNTTFESNTTTAPYNTVGQGGGMLIALGKIDLINTLFANNHAAYQAGALFGGGDSDPNRIITLTNTIFVDNTLNEQDLPSETRWQGYHTNRPMNDGGQNIQFPQYKPTYNNDVNNNITANPIYIDPLLAPLADNGGPTLTMALLSSSPARDAALAEACPAFDQRGFVRTSPCDIGPFEFNAAPFVIETELFLPLVAR